MRARQRRGDRPLTPLPDRSAGDRVQLPCRRVSPERRPPGCGHLLLHAGSLPWGCALPRWSPGVSRPPHNGVAGPAPRITPIRPAPSQLGRSSRGVGDTGATRPSTCARRTYATGRGSRGFGPGAPIPGRAAAGGFSGCPLAGQADQADPAAPRILVGRRPCSLLVLTQQTVSAGRQTITRYPTCPGRPGAVAVASWTCGPVPWHQELAGRGSSPQWRRPARGQTRVGELLL